MKTLQKLRKRQNGVNIVSLALGKKDIADDETLVVRDDKALTSHIRYCNVVTLVLSPFRG